MLIDGEIDLLSDVSYTPERSELMLYSSLPMGREEYFAFVSPQSESGVHSGDYAAFNGKRIGVNKGTYQEAILRDWLVKRGVQAEIVELTESDVIVADSGEDPNYETFLLDCFPNWKHERFENMEACFQSVADGKTDCVLVSGYRRYAPT